MFSGMEGEQRFKETSTAAPNLVWGKRDELQLQGITLGLSPSTTSCEHQQDLAEGSLLEEDDPIL